MSNFKIDKVKVFGERHTATNAVSSMILSSWPVQLLGFEYLGWKHRIAPKYREWSKKPMDFTLIVFTVRNPYTWLKAMHRRPYCPHQPNLSSLSFSDFVQFPMEDYENPCVLWNEKNKKFLKLCRDVPNSVMVRIEDFSKSQELVFNRINEFLVGGSFCSYDGYSDGYNLNGEAAPEKIQKEVLKYPVIEESTLKHINSFLDYKVMASFGYMKVDYCNGLDIVLT